MKLSRYLWVSFCAMLALVGCGGSSTSTPPPPTIGHIYVALATQGQVTAFKAGDNGNVSPQGLFTISPSPVVPTFIAMDVPHDRLAIRSHDRTPAITLVDNVSAMNGGIGLVPAQRTITGPSTTLGTGIDLCALDGTRDLLYVTQDLGAGTGVVLVFGPVSTINGNIAPLRSFTMGISFGGTSA
jgi:hypothetical protein